MPATRTSRISGGPSAKGAQSKISFGNRSKITKPTSAKDTKKTFIDLGKADEVKSTSIEPEAELVNSEATVEPRSEAELLGIKVTDVQIKKYWRAREAERTSGRVHQEGVPVEEKILRLFDMSSQFGPCIGIDRMKRWKRANKLGLNPPIEVLAVLLKEEAKGNKKIEKAYVDELMGSKFVVGSEA